MPSMIAKILDTVARLPTLAVLVCSPRLLETRCRSVEQMRLVNGLCSFAERAAEVAEVARAPNPDISPCFDRPSPRELIVAGRKLAGSAQWREQGALLQHGSILVDGDQAPVSALLREPNAPSTPPATRRALLGRDPTVSEVAGALFDAIRRHEDHRASQLIADATLTDAVTQLRPRYESDSWNWLR